MSNDMKGDIEYDKTFGTNKIADTDDEMCPTFHPLPFLRTGLKNFK